jgi:hypothetical protein
MHMQPALNFAASRTPRAGHEVEVRNVCGKLGTDRMPVGEVPLRCDSLLATPISLHLHRLYAKRLTGNAKCGLGCLPLVENRLSMPPTAGGSRKKKY